ncbi:hypothetical protein AG1IA_04282 [Rhizoctonia solani AG-1 IA]|uniref:RRN7-type domain-containing protein n=1 Tax=Thanatephorus cucumeris (strain AG1-IA) TaxID=983506 RepID=L8WUL2_THACA|nr:hypothetical protein AG1IA_04282 [Rhizoctonia solani AG-1 IA]
MAVPTCPVCTSRKWRKAPGTGELICSEGHVLKVRLPGQKQAKLTSCKGYRNESNEVTDMGAHTVHKRQLRVGRRLRAAVDKGNPDIYYGPRARYLYYQCRQLILRYQIDSLVASWDLPKEAKVGVNVCRTIWLLALDVLPQPPPPQPWLYAQTDGSSERGGSAQEVLPLGEFSEAQTPEDTDEPEGLSDDEADIEAQMNQEIENLLREASETDSNPDIKKMDASEGQRAYNKNTRYTLYDSTAANISILVLTCWWLRVPVIYSDFVSTSSSEKHGETLVFSTTTRAYPTRMSAVTPILSRWLMLYIDSKHAPTVAALHVITRRIARRLHLVHGVDIPELNAAPILWRAVRAFQGPPMLYTMVKILMERLKVPLTIHPALAPAPAPGVAKYAGDWAPIEVTMSLRTADTLTEKEIDRYLEVAERALKTSRLGSLKSLPAFQGLMSIYEQVHTETGGSTPLAYVQDNSITPEGLRRPEINPNLEKATNILPGEQLTIWSPEDPLGALPPDYALLILTASSWSGVHNSNINHLVAILERRLKRDRGPDIGGSQRSTPEDSESDGEHIDVNQPDVSEEESESNDESKDGLHHSYQMGSQKWRSRVHQKLAGSNRKGTPQTDETSSPQTSTPPEEFRT